MQSAMMYHNPTFCFDRCLDTEELYTLLRTTKAPIKHRLQEDLKEKECVRNCGAKFDELLGTTVRTSNEREIAHLQSEAMLKMFESMAQKPQ
ncbi:hypothetical protein STCU_00602 [Strigomonas culicis]|nr:hypothetical protein STCU_00602 [Strigomonas culicis]|eukprot:EPY36405.1 hypothetical protein STCU_00602 [Strigomonas culicis]